MERAINPRSNWTKNKRASAVNSSGEAAALKKQYIRETQKHGGCPPLAERLRGPGGMIALNRKRQMLNRVIRGVMRISIAA